MASTKRNQRTSEAKPKTPPTTPDFAPDCPLQMQDDLFASLTKRQSTKSASPTTRAFLKMILSDITDDDKAEVTLEKKPTLKQIQYADSLGMEMDAWDGVSMQTMSRLLGEQKEWHGDFKATNNDYPASSIVKECLHEKGIDFDNETLIRKRSMLLLKTVSRGATVDTMKQLRYMFSVPPEILFGLKANQAQKVLKRMTIERDNGGLCDVPSETGNAARSLLFDDSITPAITPKMSEDKEKSNVAFWL